MFRVLLFTCFWFVFTNFSLQSNKIIYAFKNQQRGYSLEYSPIKTTIVGKILSITQASKVELKNTEDFKGEFQNKVEVVTLKIMNPNYKPRLGDIIYLVEDKFDANTNDAEILSELKIYSIYNTAFHGKQIRAFGYLSLIQAQPLIALAPVIEGKREESILARNKGDYWKHQKNYSQALKFYKKAIQIDPHPPENYLKLVEIYQINQANYLSTYYNLEKVWKKRRFFQNEQQKKKFYKMYSRFLIEKFQKEKTDLNLKDLKKSVKISKEGLNLYSSDFDLSFNVLYASYFILKNQNQESKKLEKILKENLKQLEKKAFSNYKIYELSILFHFYLFERTADLFEKENLSKKLNANLEKYFIYLPKNLETKEEIIQINENMRSFNNRFLRTEQEL